MPERSSRMKQDAKINIDRISHNRHITTGHQKSLGIY